MAMITKTLVVLVAPILTYTADEIIENAPAVIKGGADNIFDMHYVPVDAVASLFNESAKMKIREGYYEIVDGLKKEKKIKSTLELMISTKSSVVTAIDRIEAEDWFVVSEISDAEVAESLGSFEVDGESFTIGFATKAKCPRCWKFHSENEESCCPRCAEVLNA
jgi:isoleucyl-tRNA synthetase